MTVHVISVGRSVLDALADPDETFGDSVDLISAVRDGRPHQLLADEGIVRRDDGDRASQWLADALAGDGARAETLKATAAKVRPDQWPRNMSAEIETFDRVQGFPLPASDIAILICSDTPTGLLAGVWNALALTDGDLTRVRYLSRADDDLGKVRNRAVVVRVRGMDAGSPEGFRQAMGGLGRLARNLFSSGQLDKAEPFRFYLSGGFKAAIPYLIGLAEAVRSVDDSVHGSADLMPDDGRPYPAKAFVLHETAGPGARPIELPLRRLVASAVQEELSGYNAGVRHGKPSPALLEGYAYEVKGGRRGEETCELTPFGAGLRSLFGFTEERHGG